MAEQSWETRFKGLSHNPPQHEYFLQGSIQSTSVQQLHDRLRGICDNVRPAPFNERELTFVSKNSNTDKPIMLKARKPIDDKNRAPWQVTHLGNTEVASHTKPTTIRSNVTMAVTEDPTTWIEELGFELKFETHLNGIFYQKGRIKITITLIAKVSSNVEDIEEFRKIAQSYLVEISALSNDDEAGNEVKHFAQLLSPIVEMEKLNHALLEMQLL